MTLLICFYVFVLVCVILTTFLVARGRIKLHRVEDEANQLEDLLNSAPDGYYYEAVFKKRQYSYCSRRLCLLLNIVDKKTPFMDLIPLLNQESLAEVEEAFHLLREKEKPFDINVSTQNGAMHFTLSGRILDSQSNKHSAFVVWFKDTTTKTNLLIEERKSYLRLLKQREILTQTLNTLPFALYVEEENGTVCFSNKTHLHQTQEEADVHWVELKLDLKADGQEYLLKYGQDKTTEQGLTALLNDADRAYRLLLKEIPYAVAFFDATAHLKFFNLAFCDIWHLEQYFLKKEPSFEELLDKIQEKGTLPQVKDLAHYKKGQMTNFAQLTKTSEDFLYLNGGKIVRRLMIPASKGGVLILDEQK